jgi:hypothetical protein
MKIRLNQPSFTETWAWAGLCGCGILVFGLHRALCQVSERTLSAQMLGYKQNQKSTGLNEEPTWNKAFCFGSLVKFFSSDSWYVFWLLALITFNFTGQLRREVLILGFCQLLAGLKQKFPDWNLNFCSPKTRSQEFHVPKLSNKWFLPSVSILIGFATNIK